jgi:hypothetical protein
MNAKPSGVEEQHRLCPTYRLDELMMTLQDPFSLLTLYPLVGTYSASMAPVLSMSAVDLGMCIEVETNSHGVAATPWETAPNPDIY